MPTVTTVNRSDSIVARGVFSQDNCLPPPRRERRGAPRHSLSSFLGRTAVGKKNVHPDVGQKESRKTEKKVRFQETARCYNADRRICKGDLRALWYSQTELQDFRAERRITLKDIALYPSSSQRVVLVNLLQTYKAITSACKEDVGTIPFSPTTAKVFSMHGLEKILVSAIVEDSVIDRKEQTRQIRKLHTSYFSSEPKRTALIAKTCRQASRPSRIFAHWTAVMSAMTV